MSQNLNPACVRCHRRDYHLNADRLCPECPAILAAEQARYLRKAIREVGRKRNAVRGGRFPVFRDPDRQALARDLAQQGIGYVYR